MKRIGAVIGLAWLLGTASAPAMAAGAAAPPLLLQNPSMSASQIAFDFAGEIWTVSREGGQAQVLVAGQGRNSSPIFSPDGRWVAFTGTYDGNTDVYVVPAAGGEPRRLTWHPGADVALGWTPDGKSVLFRSHRTGFRDLDQFWTVPVDGGPPVELPLPSGDQASFSPDGTHLAYTPFSQWQAAWKHYRGGQTARVWIADLSDSHVEKVPRENSNDKNPMWVGDTVYFLSDRDGGPISLYAYDVKSHAVKSLIDNSKGLDIKSASAGPGGIVIDHFGALEVYDYASGKTRQVPVTIAAELPEVRPHFETVRPQDIEHIALSPTGKRVLVEARGEILSLPTEKGDVRNLTQSPGVADRDPAASPDGKQIAWFSDETGEYALHIRSADGLGPVRKISLGQPGSFFYEPRWSPDSKKIVFHDKRLNLWLLDVDTGKLTRVDADLYDSPSFNFDPSWAPDSRWIVYAKQLPNHMHAAWVYSLETGKTSQITDGRSDVTFARFDRGGDYLYFTASTNEGPGAGWLDMSSLGRPTNGAVYVMVLRKDLPSPIAPESDEEKADKDKADKSKADAGKGDGEEGEAKAKTTGKGKAAEKDAAPASKHLVRIDFDHLDQRILALPIDRANFTGLEVGPTGVVFTTVAPVALSDDDVLELESAPPVTVSRFDLKARKNEQLVDDVDAGTFSVSADGSKALYVRHNALYVVDSSKAPKGGEGAVKAAASVWVDPRAEWRQMYSEAWRVERDFLYDPKLQGLNYDNAVKFYARYVDGLGGRADLNSLFEEMTGHIGVGHTFIRGGALPKQTPVRVGLLGADFEAKDGRWRITRILRGENWNPKLVSPLSQPGVDVAEGEFVLAVNGRDIRTDSEIYRYFEGLAGKQVVLTVGAKADGTGSRQVTVVPIDSEGGLRLRTWMENNRRKVDELSSGKLAYVYLPDTASGGFANFNRYYFSQVGKQGVVLDERFNHGGDIADYIVDQLKRTPQMINETREGGPVTEPAQAIFGPKVMIINQMSGSGGDALPWLFKKAQIGPLVGVRTWGGLVGIGGYPRLIDGGSITAPRWALYGTKGEWEVENIGIGPDIEVEQDPALVRQGHDPQLEQAVKTALDQLAAHPPQTFTAPAAPDRHPVLPPVDDRQ